MVVENPHKQAALTYVSLGILVIVITFIAGLVPAGRDNPLLELGIGATFLVIFAVIVYRGWWPVTALLLISNSWRVFTYFNDGLGRHVELRPYSVTPIEPQPVAFINALLMVIIVVMLARSAYVGFTTWHGRRLFNMEQTS
ncbi:hypothetical protein KFU94_58775 [Chloroflexi bacterium TSY]|nr:hypothetical protein [Chloroflexi bacterium TSY]